MGLCFWAFLLLFVCFIFFSHYFLPSYLSFSLLVLPFKGIHLQRVFCLFIYVSVRAHFMAKIVGCSLHIRPFLQSTQLGVGIGANMNTARKWLGFSCLEHFSRVIELLEPLWLLISPRNLPRELSWVILLIFLTCPWHFTEAISPCENRSRAKSCFPVGKAICLWVKRLLYPQLSIMKFERQNSSAIFSHSV